MAKPSTPTSLEALKNAIEAVEANGPLANLDALWRAVAEQYPAEVAKLNLSATDFPALTHSTVRNRCLDNKIVPKTPAGKARKGTIFNTVEKPAKPTKVKAGDVRKVIVELLNSDHGLSDDQYNAIGDFIPDDVKEKAFNNVKSDGATTWHLNGDDADALLGDNDQKTETAPITADTTETSDTEATDEAMENVAAAMTNEGSPDNADDDFVA